MLGTFVYAFLYVQLIMLYCALLLTLACVHTGAHLDPGLHGKGKRIRRTRARAVRIRSPGSAATAATSTTAADGLRPPSPRTAKTARQPIHQATNQPLPRLNRAGMSRPTAAGVTISHHPAGLVFTLLVNHYLKGTTQQLFCDLMVILPTNCFNIFNSGCELDPYCRRSYTGLQNALWPYYNCLHLVQLFVRKLT